MIFAVMIKMLYLLRHAQSADKQPSQPDKERELTSRGMKEAGNIGQAIKKLNINFDLVMSSTALRAKSTTLCVAESLGLEAKAITWNEEIYNASVKKLIEIVRGLNEKSSSVLLVGHNPSISYAAAYLVGTELGDLPPGGLATIRFTVSNWREIKSGAGELVSCIDPLVLD